MAMTAGYRNLIAAYGGSKITHIGLVNELGTELSGSPYTRKAVVWTTPDDGTIKLSEDLIFDVPGGATVAGWRGFTAATGGTNYGGEDLPPESYNKEGQYKLIAEGTGIKHE